MFTPRDFLASLAHETAILRHLHSKADPARAEWSPGEGHRNTIDLLRYISWCASVPVEALLAGDWSCATAAVERASTMTFDEFPARLDEQMEKIETLLAGVSDDDYLTREGKLPWGEPVKLGPGLVNTSLKFLTAYRLQFFQHVKSTSAPEIGTANAWMGIDRP